MPTIVLPSTESQNSITNSDSRKEQLSQLLHVRDYNQPINRVIKQYCTASRVPIFFQAPSLRIQTVLDLLPTARYLFPKLTEAIQGVGVSQSSSHFRDSSQTAFSSHGAYRRIISACAFSEQAASSIEAPDQPFGSFSAASSWCFKLRPMLLYGLSG